MWMPHDGQMFSRYASMNTKITMRSRLRDSIDRNQELMLCLRAKGGSSSSYLSLGVRKGGVEKEPVASLTSRHDWKSRLNGTTRGTSNHPLTPSVPKSLFSMHLRGLCFQTGGLVKST